jgi:ACR3 family arsenite transporter
MLTLLINWLMKPFSMLAVGIFFFEYVFVDWVEPASAESYLAGMILLGVAPCTAMVFVWSQLVRGDPNYTLVQVTINDLILIVAFAPIAGLLLGVSDIPVPWDTLALSTLLYVVLPLLAGMGLRRWLLQHGQQRLDAAIASMRPLSIGSLLLTVTLLFGFQANTMIDAPEVVVIIAIPLLVQTYGIFFLAWFLAARLNLPPAIAGPACLIGTSNFFELAVAVAIALFGLHSGAALATVVGVLVEVPVMLSLVWWVNRFQTLKASTVSRTS